MKVTLDIQRFNPQVDEKPYFIQYEVDTNPTDRIIDLLVHIKRNIDRTLTFRKSCSHGICGSDSMRINGTEALACKVLVQTVANDGDTIRLEPLRWQPLERDLAVNQEVFFEKFRAIKPYFQEKENLIQIAPHKEYIQTEKEHHIYDEATKCILCASCYSACPVLEKNTNFIGPTALVQAARFIKDSRDKGLEPRIDMLDTLDGVWACEKKFECTKVCPREIKITKLINELQRDIKKMRTAQGKKTAQLV